MVHIYSILHSQDSVKAL